MHDTDTAHDPPTATCEHEEVTDTAFGTDDNGTSGPIGHTHDGAVPTRVEGDPSVQVYVAGVFTAVSPITHVSPTVHVLPTSMVRGAQAVVSYVAPIPLVSATAVAHWHDIAAPDVDQVPPIWQVYVAIVPVCERPALQEPVTVHVLPTGTVAAPQAAVLYVRPPAIGRVSALAHVHAGTAMAGEKAPVTVHVCVVVAGTGVSDMVHVSDTVHVEATATIAALHDDVYVAHATVGSARSAWHAQYGATPVHVPEVVPHEYVEGEPTTARPMVHEVLTMHEPPGTMLTHAWVSKDAPLEEAMVSAGHTQVKVVGDSTPMLQERVITDETNPLLHDGEHDVPCAMVPPVLHDAAKATPLGSVQGEGEHVNIDGDSTLARHDRAVTDGEYPNTHAGAQLVDDGIVPPVPHIVAIDTAVGSPHG